MVRKDHSVLKRGKKRHSFKPNGNFQWYLYWIAHRQNIFWGRKRNDRPPYSNDPIFRTYKFTNVYRVLDRVSQELLSKVIYNGRQYSNMSMFWRVLIFKHFNLGSTWDYLVRRLGDIDANTKLAHIAEVLTEYQRFGGVIYSNAYMLTASFMRNVNICRKYGIRTKDKKHEAYLKIFDQRIKGDGLDERIVDARSFQEAFELFRTVITFADFLSFQYTIDFNYSPAMNFTENDFVAIGPGTKRGMDRTFDFTGKPDYEGVINWVHREFDNLVADLDFTPLPGRTPTKVDLLNCFCEVDKYLRAAGESTVDVGRTRMKNKFKPTRQPIQYIFPPKWGIKMRRFKRL